MSVRLYNRTKHDSAILRKVLNYAARRVGVHGEVVVLVTTSRRIVSGEMHQNFPYVGYLKGWCYHTEEEKHRYRRRMIGRLAGWYEIRLQAPKPWRGPANARYDASEFLRIAMHESAHVADFREGRFHGPQGLLSGEQRDSAGRRLAHDRRPVEISARNRTEDAPPTTKAGKERHERLVRLLADSLQGRTAVRIDKHDTMVAETTEQEAGQ